MTFRVEHLGLAANNPVLLKEWYERVLGARVVFHNQQGPPFLLAMPGGAIIEIYAGDTSVPEVRNNKVSGWRHVALRVESLEAAQAELERRGVEFSEAVKPAGGGGRVLFFADAEGNLLHLVERPANTTFA